MKDLNDQESKYVTYPVLSAIISIIIIAIGWLFVVNNNLQAQVSESKIQYANIMAQLSQIQTDLAWIKSGK